MVKWLLALLRVMITNLTMNLTLTSFQAAKSGPETLGEGSGLAARYPGDVGIEHDPAVLFVESFESGSLEELGKRWNNVSNKDGKVMAFSDEVPPGSSGKRSLQLTATLGENSGGHLSMLDRSRGKIK